MRAISIIRSPEYRTQRGKRCPDRRKGSGFPSNSRQIAAPLREICVNPFNNPTARSKATPLEKRPQFAETFRLLGKGVNACDFYNT